METANIIASLSRSRLAAALVAIQVALTLAILSNCVFVIGQRVQRLLEPTGLDEENIFTMSNLLVAEFSAEDKTGSAIEQDMQTLRAIPGVIDAYSTGGIPLLGPYGGGAAFASDPESEGVQASIFRVDDHALNTLGLKVTAGRWFRPEEVVKSLAMPRTTPPVVMSRALAERLFPNGDAVGKLLYSPGLASAPVIGIVESFSAVPTSSVGQRPVGGEDSYALLVPWRRLLPSSFYVVRAREGQLIPAMHEAERRLRAVDPLRVISGLEPYTETRSAALRQPRSTAYILIIVCVLLLAVTAFGIIGLTSYWISIRRHHIGMRRALGARRVDILTYYQTENLLIVGLGALIGAALAVGMNLWLVKTFAVPRMGWIYIASGGLTVLLLGQLAVFLPARRASLIPPAVAARAS
jgi:putative ABC transport system permease protein